MKKIFVLGNTGMLGHMVLQALSREQGFLYQRNAH